MSYELYLIRHGVAEDRSDKWADDGKRPLTDKGMARMRKNARGLARLGVTLDVVLTSPLVRAKQTAEIVANAFDPKPSLVQVESLAPEGSYEAIVADLEKQSRKSRIALVCHEPGIGALAARLCGSRRPFEFKKGGICRIDVETLPMGGPGTLRWFAPPGLLKSIKK